jgi:hypothetical protein
MISFSNALIVMIFVADVLFATMARGIAPAGDRRSTPSATHWRASGEAKEKQDRCDDGLQNIGAVNVYSPPSSRHSST